ncbi:MAG: 2-amino-4-hydroxy-6-hydroxymethyldihydropteridine diphosphokinase [Betaproteobacteria bacterium]|nr:2-amino-4-hydroxy-6-hydroxymethyldihydropteridine diphosphokinase [Betaproteobacteria bacterium]
MALSPAALLAIRSTVFIGLGSNLDYPEAQVQTAIHEIDEIPDVELVKVSSQYETAPVGITDQPRFINAVAQVETTLSPHDLLRRLLEIEQRHARVRKEKNGPRTLDLDILLFGESLIDDDRLTTPHPRMHERAFVLVPLLEIAPDVSIAGKGCAKELLSKLDASGVHKVGNS